MHLAVAQPHSPTRGSFVTLSFHTNFPHQRRTRSAVSYINVRFWITTPHLQQIPVYCLKAWGSSPISESIVVIILVQVSFAEFWSRISIMDCSSFAGFPTLPPHVVDLMHRVVGTLLSPIMLRSTFTSNLDFGKTYSRACNYSLAVSITF